MNAVQEVLAATIVGGTMNVNVISGTVATEITSLTVTGGTLNVVEQVLAATIVGGTLKAFKKSWPLPSSAVR